MNDESVAARVAELLAFTREHSPFYREFFSGVAPDAPLQAYPVLDSAAFWAANTIRDNRVFTTPFVNGITFKSGGTSGQPKYSAYSLKEWQAFTGAFGEGLRRSGLKDGDRIGNLFYAGQLYASFLFFTRSLEAAGVGICYPIAGADHEAIIDTWRQFDLNVLVGVPTTLMKVLGMLDAEDRNRLSLSAFLYGGEPMFADQIAAVRKTFPDCRIRSIGVAGVDYGEMGWCDADAEPGVHHVFDESTVLEILDEETDEVIEETGRAGRLILTNLDRRLMPVIRYPVGDRGEWLDAPGTAARRFRLLGRTEEGARVGPMTLYVNDIRDVLTGVPGVQDFQLEIRHYDQRDACLIRVAVEHPAGFSTADSGKLIDALYAARKMFPDLVADGIVAPLQVEWADMDALRTNPRTGKLIRVHDLRHG